MAHRDFDAARRAYAVERDPITFALGGETFTVLFEPSLGDTLDLADAPDVDPADFDSDNPTHLTLVRVLVAFIRRAIPIEDRPRFDVARYRIPMSEAGVIIELAQYITELVTGFPTEPPASSSSGRRTSGPTSSKRTGGRSRSK